VGAPEVLEIGEAKVNFAAHSLELKGESHELSFYEVELLRLLAGLARPAEGRLLWNGTDVQEDISAYASMVTYLGHLDGVKPGLSVQENLQFSAAIAGKPIDLALRALGISHLAELPARMLSAGQKRRLALSRLVLTDTPLWLLDEPTVGLDTASIARFGTMLERHRKAGGIVVAATHVPLPLSDVAELRLT
jgi:heme exporter protein A